MTKNTSSPTFQSYMLRIWRDTDLELRFCLESPLDNKRIGLVGLPALVEFLSQLEQHQQDQYLRRHHEKS